MNSSDIPTRSFMDESNIVWKTQKPNYDLVNIKYLAEKTRHHTTGSLEKIVENLVKTWEMESSHKIDEQDWCSIDKDKFRISVNGGKKYTLQDNIKMGNYNMFIDNCPLYNASAETNANSHEIFRKAFPNGYAWELLDLFSGPPVVSFTWRHWGTFEGPYKDVSPTNETLEMFGSCIVTVTDELQIQSIDVY